MAQNYTQAYNRSQSQRANPYTDQPEDYASQLWQSAFNTTKPGLGGAMGGGAVPGIQPQQPPPVSSTGVNQKPSGGLGGGATIGGLQQGGATGQAPVATPWLPGSYGQSGNYSPQAQQSPLTISSGGRFDSRSSPMNYPLNTDPGGGGGNDPSDPALPSPAPKVGGSGATVGTFGLQGPTGEFTPGTTTPGGLPDPGNQLGYPGGSGPTPARYPTDPISSQIDDAYWKQLGRQGSTTEIAEWARNARRLGIDRVLAMIAESPEAVQFRAAHPIVDPTTIDTSPMTPPPGTPVSPPGEMVVGQNGVLATGGTTGGTTGNRFGGSVPGSRFTGFDLSRQYGTDSAKGTFLGLAERSGVDPTGFSKEQAAAWFRQHIQPGLEAAGFDVMEVQGDRALIATTENPSGEWVDFLVNAGGGNAQYGWQSDLDPGTSASGAGGRSGASSGGTGSSWDGQGDLETAFWSSTQGIDPSGWSKDQAEAWFTDTILPGLLAQGLNARVIGDTAIINGVEYDFLTNAGGGNASWAWGRKAPSGGRIAGGGDFLGIGGMGQGRDRDGRVQGWRGAGDVSGLSADQRQNGLWGRTEMPDYAAQIMAWLFGEGQNLYNR